MGITPKKLGYRMPAEWELHAGCWMAWPCRKETWELIGIEKAREAYAKVAHAISQYEPVTLLVSPEDEVSVALLCDESIHRVLLPMNDSWTRDTGPTFLVNEKGNLGGVNWQHNAWGKNYLDYALDNAIATEILNREGAPIFDAPFVMEGGAFHVDGEGTILTTKECLLHENRNPHLSQEEIETLLCDYVGGEKVIWLERGLVGDETNGHVDEVACFIAPGEVLCLMTEDKKDENYFLLKENYELLNNSTDAKGRSLIVHTVEAPPPIYLKGSRLVLSYINFYFANGGIVMPAFGEKEYDEKAYRQFQTLFPSRRITQVHALDIFTGGGGIHCITQQQPAKNL